MARSNFFGTDSASTLEREYVLSVTQLNEYVSSLLNCDGLLRGLSIEGEISGFKRYSGSGHCYFALKDKNASVRCVMFNGYANGVGFNPADGMRVIVSGYASVYVRDGQFQFYVEAMRSVGEGELYRRFVELKKRLEGQGFFAQEHKKEIPRLPRTVGVVTSRSGAVLHDIVSVVKRRFPNMNIVFCHCSVQGAEAPYEISKAIKLIDGSELADVIIVGRGGGSIEDLWCFNDELVAMTIYECSTPIISAVGHEVDYTIADYVADMRAPTPSAAAELAVPVYDELWQDVVQMGDAVERHIYNRLNAIKSDLYVQEGRLKSPESYVGFQCKLLEGLENDSHSLTVSRLNREKAALAGEIGRLEALSPLNALKRGYTIVRGTDDNVIKSADELRRRKNAKLMFHDGDVLITVQDAVISEVDG